MDNSPEKALVDIESVLKSSPNEFSALCIQAKIMNELGQFETSLMIWHQARRVRTNRPEVSHLVLPGDCFLDTKHGRKYSNIIWCYAFFAYTSRKLSFQVCYFVHLKFRLNGHMFRLKMQFSG